MIFIDANIYLEFYNSNRPEFKKLLSSLVELKGQIFVSDQIVDEVYRNKLNVFKTSVENTLTNASFKSVVLPSHLDNIDSDLILNWNNDRKAIQIKLEASNIKLKSIYTELFEKISLSIDIISVELDKVFSCFTSYSDDIYERAKIRKQLGNPPGKPKDSSGDQLTWEILLTKLIGVQEIVIVTRDTDYYTVFENRCFLNSQLQKEILKVNNDVIIKCFNKLSDALKYYNSNTKIISLPPNLELESIADREPAIDDSIFSGGGITFVPDPPNFCVMCSSRESFFYPGFSKSVDGKTPTYHYACSKCGYHFNTHE